MAGSGYRHRLSLRSQQRRPLDKLAACGRGAQEGLQRSQAIDKRHDAIEASTAPVLRLPSSVRRPTFVG
jgi:hypothetical protein